MTRCFPGKIVLADDGVVYRVAQDGSRERYEPEPPLTMWDADPVEELWRVVIEDND